MVHNGVTLGIPKTQFLYCWMISSFGWIGVGESSFVRYVFEAIRRLSCSYSSPITSWCAEDCGGLDWRLIARK
ncbi:hypothetical protein SDJN03_19711, partial [Cucurbita argyrosperma subsp. sororia]